jgi:hypothetical protein
MAVPTSKLSAIAFLGLLVLAGCASGGGSEKLAMWTQELAASQPHHPEIIVFQRGTQRLVFIGVHHDADPRSPTHQLIASTLDLIPTRVVIVEGAPTSWGHNPPRLLEVANERPDANGLLPSGETNPTVRGALKAGSQLLGGEPQDADVHRSAADLGVTDEDLLGFYVLRVVPQWVSQKEFDDLESAKASELIDDMLDLSRQELKLGPELLNDAGAWRRWRLSRNPQAHPKMVDIEEAGPLVDGPWPTSRIAASISRARATHLYDLIKAQLAEQGSVTVVFGDSHALIQYPALTALLGKPCYRGTLPADAQRLCST